MQTLEHKIISLIRTNGPVTFEQFMAMALYDPEFGYYNAESARIGREGDFYTSSHLHPVFGAVMGRQMTEMWEAMERPEKFTVVEMGAGSGYFCKDLLDSLRNTDFFEALHYTILERSPNRRHEQQGLLGAYAGKVDWICDLGELGKITGCVFSNELLDAFPVHRVRMEGSLKEIYLDYDAEKGFVERAGDLSRDDIARYFKDYSLEIGEGYTTEVNLRIRDWLTDISTTLERGFVITVDYGYPSWDYYSEDRNRGTILCYHKHQINENPYVNIGGQDITAHVNFSAVKKWGEELGFMTAGYCGQGVFMVSLGIDDDMKRIMESQPDFVFEISRIKKLILPQGMGESHKIIIQYKGIEAPTLRGFSIRNQMRTL